MAIKGKGKSKSRGVARPPRREPLPVPVPLVQRRWVQVLAAFIAGLAIFWFAIWVTNGLRTSRDADRTATELAAQREAMQAWQAEVEAEIGAVGEFRDPQPPAVAEGVRAAIADLEDGKDPSITADVLRTTAEDLKAAAKALDAYPLADAIREKGFGASADSIISSRSGFAEALRSYRTAALLVLIATEAKDEDVAAALTERAADTLATADALIADAHRKYRIALSNAGIITTPPQP